MKSKGKLLLVVGLFLSLLSSGVYGATVPVHDPSVVVVYKDANGNSYPVNDAAGTRTKYYYVFGTQLGAAYSKDMINWTEFTPSFSVNGTVTTNYLNVFSAAAAWSKHTTTANLKENLWAPDIIFNKSMNKWCLYFSVNGDDWLSSIVMLTSTKIEGPYQYVGTVVYSGMDNYSSGAGNTNYQTVTGSSSVAARYLNAGKWKGEYGSSCIDPCVLYDESGKLWMAYGSWSGGIFLLKLSETTGLRDYSYNYGYTNFSADGAVWSGTRLRYDPYMGIHLGGGYYVSGEGSYIEYIKDPNGVGYYYMFISMGFYSPEGGYTMRVFRSSTINGIYSDITGNDAVFTQYIFNYGNNLTYGFPIMQNYKWSWWATGNGEIAQGHNSVLQDEDGNSYLIYHRKFDNGTIWHNVEVHQLFFNENGWIVSAPFEYIKSFGLTNKTYTAEDIAGLYGVITHNAVDYANLATNQESQMYINADGTLTGAYTGTWTYNYSNGRQFLTLITSAGTFQCVLGEQLMNGLSSQTLSFTGVNAANERALWGYRYTRTATTNTTNYQNQALIVGKTDYSLVWNDYASYTQVAVPAGDFEVEYTFVNYTQAVENWHNWAIALSANGQTWHLRADAASNTTFSNTTVGYSYNWNWDTEFKDVFKNKEVRVKIFRTGTSINVVAFVGGVQVYASSAKACPTTAMTAYLGGETCYLDVKKISVSQLGTRQLVGTVNEDGTYTSGFNVSKGTLTAVTGDFELKYSFFNYHNPTSTDNWDNFIVRAIAGTQTTLLRADAYAMDNTGTMTYTYDWDWANFIALMSNAYVDLTITRSGSTITYTFVIKAKDGNTYNYKVVNTGAPTTNMSFGFTCEESMVDIMEVENVTTVVGSNLSPVVSIASPVTNSNFTAPASIAITATAYDSDGSVAKISFYNGATLLGETTTTPYSYTWNSVPAGTYSITAVATDNKGASSTSQAITINVLAKDCAGVSGGLAYLDHCSVCVGGTTGQQPCSSDKIQAEDVCQFDGTVDSNNAGFEGTGFVNSPNAIDAKITLYVYASETKDFSFDVIYANGGTSDRPAKVLLNGVEILANLSLPPTGAWTTYSPVETTIHFVSGVNKLELVAITDGGLPNLDFFELWGGAVFASCPQTQTISLSPGWNLISVNLIPDDNSISTIFNGLDVQSIKTMNSFWYKSQPAYLNTLTTIEPGEGYLVNMNAAGILSIEGVTLSHTLNVVQKNGWQLIGCPYQTATPFSIDFNATNCDIIKNFDGFWIPNDTQNSIQNLEPGKGYFLKK